MSHKRDHILDYLIKRVNSFADGYRQNIAIIGEPCTGKTSLIKSLLSSEETDKSKIIPVYLEIKIEPFKFCAKRFIKSAVYQILQSDPLLSLPQDNLILIEDLKRTYPKTAQICLRVLQDIEKNKLEDAYSFMMDIPSAILEETGKRCVIILDEFHNLDNFNLKHPFGTLAKKIMIQKDAMYILLSSKNTVSQRILNEKLSMLFGNFAKIILPAFDINMARSFFQDNIRSAKLLSVHIDFLASFLSNKPLYMKIICEEIERAVFSKNIDPENYNSVIEYALTESLFKKTGVINQLFFSSLLKISEGKLLSKSVAVLISLSSENKKQSDIAKSSGLQARDISKILNKLVEMDIIVRNGSFYRFREKLFSFWLQSVYLKRISSFSINEFIEEEGFKKDVRIGLETFAREFEKEISSRMIELFKLFKNDIIQLNGKKHKFMSFENVYKSEKSIDNCTNIIAVNGKSKWLFTLKKDYTTENDISELINRVRAKKDQEKINRSVVISLGGINENAYLMAKEKKMWVWDIDSLNILMELYGKPLIIN